MKNTLLFIYSTNILVRLLTINIKNCLSPKNLKMYDPILATLLKVWPHYSQSSRENAIPSIGTSPLASCKEVPPRFFIAEKTETCRLGSWLFYWSVIEEKCQAINHKKKGKHSSRLFLSRLGRNLTKPFTNSPKKLRLTKFTYFFENPLSPIGVS